MVYFPPKASLDLLILNPYLSKHLKVLSSKDNFDLFNC